MVEVTHLWTKKEPGVERVDGWAEVKVNGAGDRIYASDIELKSIENLVATPSVYPDPEAANEGVFVTKYIHNKDEPDNYASVWVWDSNTVLHTGSVWLNIHFLGV